jgi:hypothetical protein
MDNSGSGEDDQGAGNCRAGMKIILQACSAVREDVEDIEKEPMVKLDEENQKREEKEGRGPSE